MADTNPLVDLPQVGTSPGTWAGLLVRCNGAARVVADAALGSVGVLGLKALAFAHPDAEMVTHAAHDGPDAVAELYAAIAE